MRSFAIAALAAILSSSVVSAQSKCGPGSPCPADSPCCSLYGQCGVGAYCLGGCDPSYSHTLNSCVPGPTCQSSDYKLTSLDDVLSINKYLGDASEINWVATGKPVVYNDAILLTMAQDTVGTLLESTHQVWYGKVCAKLTTSGGAGVVTAFIMMSGVRDEIDFEFVGVDLQHAQSNYYSQGVTNYHNSENLTVSNTNENVHEYCVDWQPDTLTWLIDNDELRTVYRRDTWNATANRFDYPQTPSRIMLSLWPAGLPTNDKGTVDWAGGQISWTSPYMQNGYYYAMVSEVTVECYDPPSGANVNGKKSYSYTNVAGTNNTVEITDEQMILASLYATGDNPKYDPNAKASGSASSQTAAPTQQTVPGEVGGGNRGNEGSSSVQASQATGTAGGTAASVAPSAAATQGGFSQGGGDGKTGTAASFKEARLGMGGSGLAVVVAVLGLLVI